MGLTSLGLKKKEQSKKMCEKEVKIQKRREGEKAFQERKLQISPPKFKTHYQQLHLKCEAKSAVSINPDSAEEKILSGRRLNGWNRAVISVISKKNVLKAKHLWEIKIMTYPKKQNVYNHKQPG